MPRRYQVLGQGSEGWGSASAHARTALSKTRARSVTDRWDCNASVAPAAMALPCWRVRTGRGCPGEEIQLQAGCPKGRAEVCYHTDNTTISMPEPYSLAEHPLPLLGGE